MDYKTVRKSFLKQSQNCPHFLRIIALSAVLLHPHEMLLGIRLSRMFIFTMFVFVASFRIYVKCHWLISIELYFLF